MTDEAFAILNAIYLKKLVSVEDLAELVERDLDDVDSALAELRTRDLVVTMSAGVMLTAAGMTAVVGYYANTYASHSDDPASLEWYEGFEVLNERFIGLVTDWQKSSGDPAVQERLIKVVDRLVASLQKLTGAIPRYDRYITRFSAAISKVDAGDNDLVANPRRDSIHNIWFEFHEDLLAVIGRPRDTT